VIRGAALGHAGAGTGGWQKLGRQQEAIDLGSDRWAGLMQMIRALEEVLGVEARLAFEPEQPGDVAQTYADISKARRLLGYEPRTEFRQGLRAFAEWLRQELEHEEAAGLTART